MPKTLVLFHGNSDSISATADAVAEGVRSVRFAEVDVRRLATSGDVAGSSRHRALSGADELAGHDGLVLVAANGVAAEITELIAAAAALRPSGAVTLSVGSAFVADASGGEGDDARWSLLRALARLGVVLVPASGDGLEAAKKLGHRVAHVVSWITHAKSHHHH